MTTPTPGPLQARVRKRDLQAVEVTHGEGSVLVRRTAYGLEAESTETVRVPVFNTTPAKVRVLGSVTRNLGDYNSARVEVMIEVPCYPEDSEIRRAYDYASALVDTLIPQELDKAIGGDGSGGDAPK